MAHRVGVVPDLLEIAEQVDGVEVGAHPRRVDGLDDLADVLGGVERGGDVALQGQDDPASWAHGTTRRRLPIRRSRVAGVWLSGWGP